MIEQLKSQRGHVFPWDVSVQIHMHNQQECDSSLLFWLSKACCQGFLLILLDRLKGKGKNVQFEE